MLLSENKYDDDDDKLQQNDQAVAGPKLAELIEEMAESTVVP